MTKKTVKETTELASTIRHKDDYALGALMALYNLQTQDEQTTRNTCHSNSVGFNAVDAEFLTALADQYVVKKRLTEKQLSAMRPILAKYATQLLKINGGVIPIECKAEERKDQEAEKKKASLSRTNPDRIIIQFPYDTTMVSQVKTLLGRRWVKKKKWWVAPLCLDSVERLREWGFPFSPALQKEYDKLTTPLEVVGGLEVPGLKSELFPFQREGVAFTESRKGRVLIGDEMGLGKTAQALAWLQLHPDLRPAIIVVPASVKLNWSREIYKWMDTTNEQVTIISGRETKVEFDLNLSTLYILNYDILEAHVENLRALSPKVVILDEVHYIKNKKAQRTSATKALCKGIPHIIALSGTPIINRPVEFFTTINLLDPKLFPSFWKFAHDYCGAKHNGFGWDFSGATKIEELHDKLTRSVMIRRLKTEVMKDLPPKIRTLVPMPMGEAYEEYKQSLAELREWMLEADPEEIEAWRRSNQGEALARIEALKQLAWEGKKKEAVSWVKDYLETEEKLVVFTTHHASIDYLKAELVNYEPVVIDGRVPSDTRQPLIDRFQKEPKARVFLGNIKAAGIGITLTAAHATCFMELGWTPGEHDQAEDRVHRIGQEADSVSAYYLIAEGTIENEIAELLDEKREVLAAALDGQDVKDKDLLTVLINRIREGR